MSSRKIIIVNYDTNWPAKFEVEKQYIANSLDGIYIDCFHIGSTSVPGLAAKPIIDMLLIVSSLQTLDKCQSSLKALGYISKGENGVAGRRYFYKGQQVRNFHLHAYEPAHPDIARHLAFRDYLRTYPDIAKEYQKIKEQALISTENSSDLYAKFKDPFIKKHEAIALSLSEKSR